MCVCVNHIDLYQIVLSNTKYKESNVITKIKKSEIYILAEKHHHMHLLYEQLSTTKCGLIAVSLT
jgi:hypothetical protein